MMWLSLLLLLTPAVLAEKRVNHETLERDQLSTEISKISKKSTNPLDLHTDESKYSVKAEATSQTQSQQQYHAPATGPQELGNQLGDYAELPPYESFKYAVQSQDYRQEKYPESSSSYLQQNQFLASSPEQQPQQQQYYRHENHVSTQNEYSSQHQHPQSQQQQPQQSHQQQQYYPQEVLVGNQHQSVQQKAATQKYVQENDKGTYYVNIPMSQLLAYYQNFGILQSQGKNSEQAISIPVYTPLLPQNQVYTPTKSSFQHGAQYTSAYPKHTQAVFTKTSKSPSSNHATPAATSTTLTHQLPSAAQSSYALGGFEIFMNQARSSASYESPKYQYYIMQPQHPQPIQQQQQVVYETPMLSYADIYNTPATSYVQDNSLYDQQQHNQQQNQPQYYVPAALAEQLMTQILQQAGIQNTNEDEQHVLSKQEPQSEQVHQDFTSPQYHAKFRSNADVTRLLPVSGEGEDFSSKSTFSTTSQPKTLLDSYVPSHVIAAQDANRYRERPIKLESGFLPSKINFLRSYKKRKTE